ncbi:hypothetical protein BD324DRAFT_647886 [Kockovaella imperatae]|uniref:Alcohol acetyltransferase n=1 Tax=Kockovaella imperatae TaxID=4999 RepID=A0A1Y1UU78_9TREE|nr:hypothetical protein BD324DRAFT_647886 [Kockovaella imperatae]ORX40986.1 hypothetical protein BD324DRAFT_647886 [Kockovaella imperatae]
MSSTTLTPPLSPSTPLTTPNLSHIKRSHRPSSLLLTPPYTPKDRFASSSPSGSSFSSAATSPRSFVSPSPGLVKSLQSFGLDDQPSNQDQSVRLLSDNELSYFLPSRADGVNDMYLHHRLTAPSHLVEPDRVFYLWAYQLLRHPLLASHLRVRSYEDVSFVFPHAKDVDSALAVAEDRFIYIDDDESYRDVDVIDSYLNGPRTLSSNRLAALILADRGDHHEFMLLSTHYLGDGMALHTFMNEFYTLLGSTKTSEDFLSMIQELVVGEPSATIPGSLEDRIPQVGNGSRFASTVGKIDNKANDDKLIGGQSFPSNSKKMDRRTVVPTFAYSPEETKRILGKCKENGVTIAHAMFALCNIAWARRVTNPDARQHPCLIYSALNLRPNMIKAETEPSYFHLAVGYFNIVLSSLIPSSLSASELFWHRARQTKAQTIKAVKSPFVVARSRETNRIRRERAIKWAKIDDEEERKKQEANVAPNGGLGLGLGSVQPDSKITTGTPSTPGPKFAPLRATQNTPDMRAPPTPTTPSPLSKPSILPPASQKALMGVSMLGNLDGMYKHASYPDIHLQALTTGSRQRPGGLLLFAYTFAGKLWMSLGYDVNGFQEGVIEGFWEEVQNLVKEVML